MELFLKNKVIKTFRAGFLWPALSKLGDSHLEFTLHGRSHGNHLPFHGRNGKALVVQTTEYLVHGQYRQGLFQVNMKHSLFSLNSELGRRSCCSKPFFKNGNHSLKVYLVFFAWCYVNAINPQHSTTSFFLLNILRVIILCFFTVYIFYHFLAEKSTFIRFQDSTNALQ